MSKHAGSSRIADKENSVQFINLTPHSIMMRDHDGSEFSAIPATSPAARMTEFTSDGNRIEGVPVENWSPGGGLHREHGHGAGLPLLVAFRRLRTGARSPCASQGSLHSRQGDQGRVGPDSGMPGTEACRAMTARHAGPSRIADTALLDQVKAAVAEMRTHLSAPPLSDPGWSLQSWAGRALYLLEEIGRLSE